MGDIKALHEVLSQGLDGYADKFLEIQSRHLDAAFEYNSDDVMNATIIFNSIIGSKYIHRLNKKGTSLDAGIALAQDLGDQIHKLVLLHTGVNTKTHYDKTRPAG